MRVVGSGCPVVDLVKVRILIFGEEVSSVVFGGLQRFVRLTGPRRHPRPLLIVPGGGVDVPRVSVGGFTEVP